MFLGFKNDIEKGCSFCNEFYGSSWFGIVDAHRCPAFVICARIALRKESIKHVDVFGSVFVSRSTVSYAIVKPSVINYLSYGEMFGIEAFSVVAGMVNLHSFWDCPLEYQERSAVCVPGVLSLVNHCERYVAFSTFWYGVNTATITVYHSP